MNCKNLYFFIALSVISTSSANANDFIHGYEALPFNTDAKGLVMPVFDFDGDGCLPSAGISRTGQKNGGLNPTGPLGGNCRHNNFLDLSNTYHRYACKTSGGDEYCGHIYALYFKKDQILNNAWWPTGHRHDWEFVASYTKNGTVTHGAFSTHGNVTTSHESNIPKDSNGRMKFVYHKSGGTHPMRFATSSEDPENPYDEWVTPPIMSWHSMRGDGIRPRDMRAALNTHDYGTASVPTNYANFINNLNEGKPSNYPTFVQADNGW